MSYPVEAPLFAALCNIILTFFVISRNLRSSANWVFLMLGLCLSLWNLGTYLLFCVEDKAQALFWARCLQFGVIFIPVTGFHLALLITQIRIGRWLYLLYAFYILLALSNFTDFFISDVKDLEYAYYSVAGPGFWIYCLTFGLNFGSIYMLIRKRRQLPALHKARLTPLIVSQAILVVTGGNDILPIIGIYQYPFTNVQIYPYGSIAACLYGILVGYSVLQHQFLGVHVMLSRFAAHAIRLLFLFLTGVLTLFLIAAIAQEKLTQFGVLSALGAIVVSSLAAALFFPRLFGSDEEKWEQWLWADRFEYHDQIRDFIRSIDRYRDSALLLAGLHDLMVDTLQLRSYQIFLLDERTRWFALFRNHPAQPIPELQKLRSDSPIFRLFQETRVKHLAFKLAYVMPGENVLEREARRQLASLDPEFCFPFYVNDEPFGLLLIGEKVSGKPYSSQDVRLLTWLVECLGVHLNQIRLTAQIHLALEQELLGRMSGGMAHDLNNLITPVWTCLQLFKEQGAGSAKACELLPMAIRGTTTIQAYIKEALFFAQHQKPRIEAGRLDLLVKNAADLSEDKQRRKQLILEIHTPRQVVIEMDEVLLQRLVRNLLSNAIDASPTGGVIKIDLDLLSKTEHNLDWWRLCIVDQGNGINEQNLKLMATPYYTTKDHGDEERGFGLGLAICRKIVHLHGGKLTIASELNKGTTVQVDLPSRQDNHRSSLASVRP